MDKYFWMNLELRLQMIKMIFISRQVIVISTKKSFGVKCYYDAKSKESVKSLLEKVNNNIK